MLPPPLRFAIDTNILIGLALAQYADEEMFIKNYDRSRNPKAIYEYLLAMQKMIDQRKVELILPYFVNQEILNISEVSDRMKKKLSPKEYADRKAKVAYRNMAIKYMKAHDGIKKVCLGHHSEREKKYCRRARGIAEFYCESPDFCGDFNYLHEKRRSPFITMANGEPCKDAIIMAEATLLGLDLLSMDGHFINDTPFDLPKAIQSINKQYFSSTVRPYRFQTMVHWLESWDKEVKAGNKTCPFPRHRPLITGQKYYDHGKYMNQLIQVINPSELNELGRHKIKKRKALFALLDNPIDVENLVHEPPKQTRRLFISESEK